VDLSPVWVSQCCAFLSRDKDAEVQELLETNSLLRIFYLLSIITVITFTGINSINSLNMGNSASIPRDVGADEFPSLLNTADSPSMRIAPGEHDVQMHDTMGDIPSARPIGGSVIKDLL